MALAPVAPPTHTPEGGDAMPPLTLSRHRHRVLTECLADRAEPLASGGRFAVYRLDPALPPLPGSGVASDPDDLVVVHDFAPAEIDNNIARDVAEDLLPLLLGGTGRASRRSPQDLFEHMVGAVVRSVDGNERRAWHRFYDNTLAALRRAGQAAASEAPRDRAQPDYIADFAAIYRRVASLIDEVAADSVLDVATCFGFLPLLLASGAWSGARHPGVRPVVACDLNPALMALAESYARDRQVANVRFVTTDILDEHAAGGRGLPISDFDVVTAIHFLEHLEPAATPAALAALWRRTRRRLIVAVPIEAVPDARFGHRQVFDRDRLAALARQAGGRFRCFDDHGAWLVIDRLPSPAAGPRPRLLESQT
ncbi:MAG: class I SAM-dependent methyltransferase [Rhodospirillales bacterium]|nr:MAG: class I SAM-dependent methyltransferase [Rhodospirillales bacterium]